MENTSEFQFEGTVLDKYTGSGGHVVIPEGVTSVGFAAFQWCQKLTSVTIPQSVVSIDRWAFSSCEKLPSIIIPESVTSVGNYAFSGCYALNSVAIPSGVTALDESVFHDCYFLTALSMGREVFAQWNMKNVSLGMAVRDGDRWSFYGYAAKTNDDNLTDFVRTGKWNTYDLELINNGPMYKYKAPARLLGALGRLVAPVELTDECREFHLEFLIKNAKKLIPIAETLRCPAIVEAMKDRGIINDKNRKTIAKLLTASQVPEIAAIEL